MWKNNNSHTCLLLFFFKHLSYFLLKQSNYLNTTYEIGLIIANCQSYGLNISVLNGPTDKMLYSNYTEIFCFA